MAKRERIVEEAAPARKNNYFTSNKDHIQFVSTGCTLVDCALGGGFALGRIVNIVGDKSTSKTGLATECLINFCRDYPEGQAAYRDIENAFDAPYAEAMGLPLSKIDMGSEPLPTVEAWHRDLEKFVDKQIKLNKPGIYVLDSLDALSDEAELERDIGEASYGGGKAKKTSEMFRRLTPKIESSKVLLIVVSQVRDNIGAMFGEKHKRSGGKALDFYASQIVWLSHIGRLTKTINKVKRPYGIEVKAQVKKNKIGMPFRECEFEFHFGYGVEDLISNLNWLDSIGCSIEPKLGDVPKMDDAAYKDAQKQVAELVKVNWAEIEKEFLPTRTKYA
jgi:protein RecA